MIRHFAAFAMVFLATQTVVAQSTPARLRLPIRVADDGLSKDESATKATPAQQAAESTSPASATAAENVRLQRLRQLQFDRRPSAILKAWSTPEIALADEAAKAEPADSGRAASRPLESAATEPAKPQPSIPSAPSVLQPGVVAAESDLEAPSASTANPSEANATTSRVDAALELELKTFQRNVTLGDWVAVKKYLAELPKVEGTAAFQQLLSSLNRNPAVPSSPTMPVPNMPVPTMPVPNVPGVPIREANVFAIDDLLGLAAAAPTGVEKNHVPLLAGILRLTLVRGNELEIVVRRLELESAKPPGDGILTRRHVAQMLFAAGHPIPAGGFLPTADQAREAADAEALNLLAQHFLARFDKEKKSAHLQQAWTVTQGTLALPTTASSEKDEALTRAVELAPRVAAELGQRWLDDSFTNHHARGREIIATIGTLAARGLERQPANPDFRLKLLQLQKTAVEALLAAAPQPPTEWRDSLRLLAANWRSEAEFAHQFGQSSSVNPILRRDQFGNLYYYDEDEMMRMQSMNERQNRPQPIAAGKVLDCMPSDAWLALIDDAARPSFGIVTARLYLKVSEEAKAFPYIASLANVHPERAQELADEFLRVWTRNHDQNDARNRTRNYFYMFGFERRAESIPLTRSKQERSLHELSEWVARLRDMPNVQLNEELLARAFTTSHSSAEVYKIEAIEKVFGPMERLKPKTLAALVQQMRSNLAGQWREPALQEKVKSKRKQKDIQAEIERGYRVAETVVDGALQKFSNDWSLRLARAAILHDENNYRQELTRSTEFTPRRQAALGAFRDAANFYAAVAPTLSEDEETTEVYEQWFYAGLGAVDLASLDSEKQPDARQPALLRQSIQALGGPAADRHLAKFANALFTRLSAVNPAVKFRYLRSGFEIVGDHKQAQEAHKVFDYYKDLVREIRLESVVDGSTTVARDRPFGVFVNLRHTREIERESGGFGRYLQNQQNQPYAYNYGRPLENYRDKFTDFVRNAVQEHFELLSVTFQDEKANSKATQEYGWRVTPYAYVLLKPRGEQVDMMPSLKLDLDFLDTSGYVILPIESPAVAIEAAATAPSRPVKNIKLAQTLDERQAAQGKLVLEIKATSNGLAPELGELVDLHTDDFDIVTVDDPGVSVSRFDPESTETAIVSERSWLISMQAKTDLPERPKQFTFGTPKLDVAENVFQRYVDADLKSVETTVSLEQQYGEPRRPWLAWSIAGVIPILCGAAGVLYLRRAKPPLDVRRYRLPDPLTPFTLLALLRDIQNTNGLGEAGHQELATSIARLERQYFGRQTETTEPLNLRAVAEHWLQRTRE